MSSLSIDEFLFQKPDQPVKQVKAKSADDTAERIHEHVEQTARAFRDEVLVNFIADGIQYAQDERQNRGE